MKPRLILLFMAMIMALCWIVALSMPQNGIIITEGLTLNFKWESSDSTQTYADINDIVASNQLIENLYSDTISFSADTSSKVRPEPQKNVVQGLTKPIEFPNSDSTILYSFFEKLDQCQQKQVRILHYGDSQIEGDRITGYLRYKFQNQFGGSGPGLLPAIPPLAESASIMHEITGDWQKHAIYFPSDTLLAHRKFGILGSFSRFLPIRDGQSQTQSSSGDIVFSRSAMAYANVNNFNVCRIFYGNLGEPVSLSGYINDSLVWFENLDSCNETRQMEWKFSSPPKKFSIHFTGADSPDIYAIALDSKNGVAIDNLPLRGSSGAEFTKLDAAQYGEMARLINGGLIIYQFGVNVVPNKAAGYTYYQRLIERQIGFLKQAMPGIPILMVSVSDMSEKNGDSYQTYSNLEMVIEAQRKAAETTGSAFWNLYEAMGGKNSMPAWVNATPSLAQKDYVHFNRKGGHIVAQMLYSAIESEYQKYLKSKQLTVN